jgi:hypothetical protein
MYRKIRRELSMKNIRQKFVCMRTKPEKMIISFYEKLFKNSQTHTDSGDNVHEKKIFDEEKTKSAWKQTLFEETFLRGGLGRSRKREKKRRESIEARKCTHRASSI